jgi:glycosyltransferase involved in cell wall biosynthesis
MISRKSLVSVVIPVYNGERYLREAIESVLSQDHRPMEVIVVNDGSTDNTETVARRYGNDIMYIQQENRGPAAARNRGLQMSLGDVISFLDVDDLWSGNKLSLQLARLSDNPFGEIVLGLSQPMKLQAGEEGKAQFEKWYDPFCALLLSAAVFRKSVFEKVGLFDETLCYGEDTDWFMRAREMGVSMTIMEEVTLFYRRHESNMTLDSTARNRYFIKALKKSLDRRRQEGDGLVAPFPKLNDLEKVIRHHKNSLGREEIK